MQKITKYSLFIGNYLAPIFATLLLAIVSGNAAEFTWLETAVSHTSALGGVSTFQPGAGVPANWNSPDDYLTGTAHFQLEIVDKPSQGSIHYSVCLEQGNTSACAESYHTYLPGFHQWTQSMADWPDIGDIDLSNSYNIVLSIRDCKDQLIDPDQNDWCGAPLLGLYYPMEANFTAKLVSQGAVFSGWTNTAAIGPDLEKGKDLQILFQENHTKGIVQLTLLNQTGFSAKASLVDTKARLIHTWVQPDNNSVWTFNSESINESHGSGVYFLQIIAGNQVESIRLMLKEGL